MKMELHETGIRIYPETVQDVIYIEKHLGLNKEGDFIRCIRRNVLGLSSLGHLETPSEETEQLNNKDDYTPAPRESVKTGEK